LGIKKKSAVSIDNESAKEFGNNLDENLGRYKKLFWDHRSSMDDKNVGIKNKR